MGGITLQDVLNGIISLGSIATAIASVGMIIHLTIVRPIRKFLRREIVSELVGIRKAVDQNTDTVHVLEVRINDHIIKEHHQE